MYRKIKTKLVGILFFILLASFYSQTQAKAVIPLSSGVKKIVYEVVWCSPHSSSLTQVFGTDSCKTGYFTVDGASGIINYNGKNFTSGEVGVNTALSAGSTSTNQGVSNLSSLVSVFSGISNIKLHAEGIVTIKVFMLDYADNSSIFKLTYRIDKTAPNIVLNDISENTDTTFAAGKTQNSSSTVWKNDSVNNSTETSPTFYEKYIKPNITFFSNGDYSGDIPSIKTTHERKKLNTIYFKDGVSNFTNIIKSDDTFDNSLKKTSSSTLLSYLQNKNLVSDVSDLNLFKNSSDISLLNSTNTSSFSINTDKLTNSNNVSENTQGYYFVRLYDNSYGLLDNLKSTQGNYSETSFYAVRDNIAPNMGGNSLAGTNENQAIEKTLSFPDNSIIFDKTTSSYSPRESGFSKFFAASDARVINYDIKDYGIVGNGITSGTNSDYEMFNAGFDGKSKIKFENTSSLGIFSDFYTLSTRFANTGNANFNFSKVDNNKNSGNYRNYLSKFEYNSQNKGICDAVGNCITPNLKLRVVADSLDESKSELSVNSNTKVFANNSDAYELSYKLKDKFSNSIVPVHSLENNNTPVKSVNSNIVFDNKLYNDLRTNNLAGNKQVTLDDLENDNKNNFSNNINSTSSDVYIEEDSTKTPNGEYKIKLRSKVPTHKAYQFVSNDTRLFLNSLRSEAKDIAPSSITYPSSGNRLGKFDNNLISGNNDIVNISTGDLKEIPGFNNISLDESNYGKIESTGGILSFSNYKNTKKANFEFASPIVYGLKNMKVLIDGQYVDFNRKVYKLSNIDNYNIYEKFVSTESQKEQINNLNFKSRLNTSSVGDNVNPGVYLTSKNPITNFFPGTSLTSIGNDLSSSMESTQNGFPGQVMMSSVPGKKYSSSLKTGYISGLSYVIDGVTIKIPSVGRNISNAGNCNVFDRSRSYMSDTYEIGSCDDNVTATAINSVVTNIAITGLTKKYNGITTDGSGSKANAQIEGEISRSYMFKTVKDNIIKVSKGIESSNNKKWCNTSDLTSSITQDFLQNGKDKCNMINNGELISFIDLGNDTNKLISIDCGSSNCSIDKKRTIIVKNGNIYIKSNITSLNNSGKQTAGQLALVSVNDKGLQNINLSDFTNVDMNSSSNKMSAMILIDPELTNIDAFLVSQGSIISYSDTENKLYNQTNTTEAQLRNQLSIFGSVLSLNTIGGSRETNARCPYIVGSICNENISQIFDLVYLRRFSLVQKSIFTGLAGDKNTLVTYHKDYLGTSATAFAKKVGGLIENNECTNGYEGNLRCIMDNDYKTYPMIIERDTRWNANPSILFKY